MISNGNSHAAPGRLFGVLVTYQRPQSLEKCLRAIISQQRQLDELVIVDNAPSPKSTAIVADFRELFPRITYIPSSTNVGPAGGRFLGTEAVLTKAKDSDWVVFLDDDDPMPTSHIVEDLAASIAISKLADPTTAGVALRGARLNRRTGRVSPVRSVGGTIAVDHLHGGFFPSYLVGALRKVGSFRPELVFGFEELELGLRITRAGFTLYVDGDLYRSVEQLMGHPDPLRRPRLALASPSLRRYYSLRNHLYVLRKERLLLPAAWWALVTGVMKPLLWLPLRPKRAYSHLRINVVAIRDAYCGRLGPRDWRDCKLPASLGSAYTATLTQ